MTPRPHPRPPVDPAALNGVGGAMWTNLGYWRANSPARGDAVRYQQAAAELARRVGVAAGLGSGDVVVDYACGYGDSLRLWVEEFDARRVVGVEPDPSLCREIETRIRSWGLANRIVVKCAAAEEIVPSRAAADVSAVVCVDAAYHFRTRSDWFRALGADSPSGLRLGLADLAVVAGRESSLRLHALANLMRIPRENLMSTRAIGVACEDAGFTMGACEQVSEAVLDGFATYAPGGTMSIAVTRAAIAFARRARLLDYFVIGATR